MSRYRELLGEFAHYAGLSEIDMFLASQELLIDGVTIGLTHDAPTAGDPGDLVYFSSAGSLANDARTVEVYRFLLGINAFWQGTAGYTLGLQGESDSVVISGRLPLSALDGEILDHVVRRFAKVVAEWSDMLEPESEPEAERDV